MEYKVIYQLALEKLVEEVNEHIKDGWKPIGGIAASATHTTLEGKNVLVYNCYQAMVRETQSHI